MNYEIVIGWVSHEIYCTNDKGEQTDLYDSYTNDDPYYMVVDADTGERLEMFNSYDEAVDHLKELEK